MDGDVFPHRKRPREDVDTHNSTARVVEAALAEVKAAKLSKERRSLATPKDVRYTSGLSLAALKDGGDAEGLTLEGLASKAAKQRILMRSEYAAEMLDVSKASQYTDVGEVEAGEAVLKLDADEKEDAFEPFNLKAEREEGYFDEDGNYVEYKVGEDEKDEWLKGVHIDESLAAKGKQTSVQKISNAASTSESLSEAEVARLKGNLAEYLEPRETVLNALKRLGSSSTARLKEGKMKDNNSHYKGGNRVAALLPENRVAFEQITELSSVLMMNGEYDVYSLEKESFERAATLFASGQPTRKIGGVTTSPEDIFGKIPHEIKIPDVPDGYTMLDPSTGLYHNPKNGLSFSPETGAFTDGCSWWFFDSSTQQFVKWE